MQYDPIKRSLGKFFAGTLMRKILYSLLDMLLLRTWHVKRALRKLSRQFPDNASILDAGSGFGQYTWRMSRMNCSWNINAIDIDSDHIEECNNFFKRAGLAERVVFRQEDLTQINDTDKYNFILSVDVMEHIEDDVTVFKNFHHSLKENGALLISTPSDQGGSDAHDENDESFISEHVRNGYGAQEIKEKLSMAGFSKIDVKYTYGKPGNISWRLSMRYPIKMLNSSYLFFILLPFYYILFFPISIILNFFDLYTTHKTGTGLLVIARK